MDYNLQFKKMADESLENKQGKTRLLLHTCCAPCLLGAIERIVPFFDLTVLFFNPNIDTKNEFDRRLNEVYRVIKREAVIAIDYEHNQFLLRTKDKNQEREGGARCFACFDLRLKFAAQYANDFGFDAIATTLTLSPHKNAQAINEIGFEAVKGLENPILYIPSDFKKEQGALRSKYFCEELKIYRQNYCGCNL